MRLAGEWLRAVRLYARFARAEAPVATEQDAEAVLNVGTSFRGDVGAGRFYIQGSPFLQSSFSQDVVVSTWRLCGDVLRTTLPHLDSKSHPAGRLTFQAASQR